MQFFKYVLFPLSIVFLNNSSSDFKNIFTFDHTWAIRFLHENADDIHRISCSYGHDPKLVSSLIFPELIRYSMVKNYLETSALEVGYVKYGKNNVDFSVGYFQMKPSFAEKIEHYCKKNPEWQKKYAPLIRFSENSTKRIRKERLERLNDLRWQTMYLNAFLDITQNLHDISGYSYTEKIKFLATAYNHDFDISGKEITAWCEKKIFPYGMNSHMRQYAYSSISLDYYHHYSCEIFGIPDTVTE